MRGIERSRRNVALVKTPEELSVNRGKSLVLEVTQVRAKGGGVSERRASLVTMGEECELGSAEQDVQHAQGG